jgi:hypothetical protein
VGLAVGGVFSGSGGRPRIQAAPDRIRWLAQLGALQCACGEGGHWKEAMASDGPQRPQVAEWWRLAAAVAICCAGGDSWRPAVLSASETGVLAVVAVA